MDKKISRRAAIGLGIGGMAAAPFIIHALKAPYAVPSPTGTQKVTMKYLGQDITLDVPLEKLGTPKGIREAKAQVLKQLENNPTYIEVNRLHREELREQSRLSTLAGAADLEKRQLENLARLPMPEAEKQAAAKKIKSDIQAARDRCLDHIDKLHGSE